MNHVHLLSILGRLRVFTRCITVVFIHGRFRTFLQVTLILYTYYYTTCVDARDLASLSSLCECTNGNQ